MSWSEVISIIGSFGSASAVAVSLWIFWRQRNAELIRLKNERENELFALKKIISLNCELIKTNLEKNSEITNIILSGKYAGITINKLGSYFYVSFKDGFYEDKNDYYWKTCCRIYFLNRFLDNDLLILSKHNSDVISDIMSIYRIINDYNNLLEALINDFDKTRFDLMRHRCKGISEKSHALDLWFNELLSKI